MIATILSFVTVIAAVALAFVSRRVARKSDANINAMMLRADELLAELEALQHSTVRDSCSKSTSLPGDGQASWTDDALVAYSRAGITDVIVERDAEESQLVRDRMLAILAIRGAATERLTDVEARWVSDRNSLMVSSMRATRRRDRGIPHSREIAGWASLH